jgi:hypothetical protein
MRTNTNETEILLLLCAAQLIQAADVAPGALKKKLHGRAEQLLEEAEEGRAEEALRTDQPAPFVPAIQFPGSAETYTDFSFDDGEELTPPPTPTPTPAPAPPQGSVQTDDVRPPTAEPEPRFEQDGAAGPMLGH